jgi:hypothetical protein
MGVAISGYVKTVVAKSVLMMQEYAYYVSVTVGSCLTLVLFWRGSQPEQWVQLCDIQSQCRRLYSPGG